MEIWISDKSYSELARLEGGSVKEFDNFEILATAELNKQLQKELDESKE